MKIKFELNGSMTEAEIKDDACLKDTLRELGCASVKCGCDTANCGMCTVLVDDRPVLSCAYLSARVNGKRVTTLEGLTDEAMSFARCMAEEGADQCGFCNPGFVVNAIAFKRYLIEIGRLKNSTSGENDIGKENPDTDKEKTDAATEDICIGTDEIREFMAGNICRCTGYASQERAIIAYLSRNEKSDGPV